jgi:hypothetical protein
MRDEKMLSAIAKELLKGDKASPLARNQVREWASSADLEVLGAVFKLMHDPDQYSRIRPELSLEDYRRLHLKYYERCLIENPNGDWCDSRYLAAHSLTNWFLEIWKDRSVPGEVYDELKSLLSRLYRHGDEKLRTAIVTGVLEHLFTNKEVRGFFQDWELNPELSGGYHEALAFSKAAESES